MIYLYVQAPFAAFRTFTAGWYRPTAMFMTHSAAYGLLLNLAGIESRLREGEDGHDDKTPASLMAFGLPACEIALGIPVASSSSESTWPRLQSVYQQLHNYPVGSTGKARAEECRGNKYNITPVRREFLSGLKVVIALRADAELESKVQSTLKGEAAATRYGLPFLGDNAFLPDRIEHIETPAAIRWRDDSDDSSWYTCDAIRWYRRLGPEARKAHPRATRLTIQIDRANLSQTQSALFAPSDPRPAAETPPDAAWELIRSLEKPPGQSRR